MLLAIELGSDVMQNIVCNTKSIIEGSLNRNFRQYGELKSSSRVVKSVDRRCNSQKVRRKEDTCAPNVREVTKCCVFFIDSCVRSVQK